MPARIILAQDLLEPHATVERIVANGLGHQHCQALAAVGGGQQPDFTMSVTQPKSATTADRCYNSSAKSYGFTPALTPRNRVVFGIGGPDRHCQWGGHCDADQPDLVPTWTPPHLAYVSVALRKPTAAPTDSIALSTAAC